MRIAKPKVDEVESLKAEVLTTEGQKDKSLAERPAAHIKQGKFSKLIKTKMLRTRRGRRGKKGRGVGRHSLRAQPLLRSPPKRVTVLKVATFESKNLKAEEEIETAHPEALDPIHTTKKKIVVRSEADVEKGESADGIRPTKKIRLDN